MSQGLWVRSPPLPPNNTDLLNVFGELPQCDVGFTRLLFKCDVKSLYTVIPNRDGLIAVKFWLERYNFDMYPVRTVLRLVELVLCMNHFEFNGENYTQIRGVSMGTRMGPSYACLFMGWVEHNFFETYSDPVPETYKRYIDDSVGSQIVERSKLELERQNLERFIAAFNSFHEAVELTSEISEESLDCLDVILTVEENGCISTSIFYKPTDSHSYVDYSSNHPSNCLDSIPYSQFLRLRRICSDDSDFKVQCDTLSGFFRDRGYPQSVIDKSRARCERVDRRTALVPKQKAKLNKIPLVLPFYEIISKQISKIIFRNGRILSQDPDIGFLFRDKFISAYKNHKNIKQLTVRSKLPSLIEEIPGNFPCGSNRCLTCPVLCAEPVISGPCGDFDIKHSFSCTSSCVIYVISCTKCDVLYVGETGRTLRERKNGHFSDIRCNRIEKNEVAEHFCSSPHNLQTDFAIRAVYAVPDTHERRLFEAKLIRKLGTLKPLGMNREVSSAHRC